MNMEEQVSLWRGIRPLVGTVVGVGLFALPYVFAQAGYGIALLELGILAGVQIALLSAYADLALAKKHHARFFRIVGDAFGPLGKALVLMSFFGTLWGAMIAYLLAGGTFLSYIVRAWVPVTSYSLSILFGVFCMLLLFGGAFVVQGVQKYLIPFFLGAVGVLAFFSRSSFDTHNLVAVSWQAWTAPLGVLLFSLSAISVVPEMRDLFQGKRERLLRALFWGMAFVVCIYVFFAALVVGIAGAGTPPQAIAAFASVAPWMVLVGSVLGLATVTAAYVNVGSALVNTVLYDFRVRYLPSWMLIGGIPFLAVVFGVRDFVGVLSYAGGALNALMSILVLLAYEKARRAGQLPAHARVVSPFVVFGLFLVFFVVLVMTLRG